jgi:hypothetical protein
VPQTAPSDATPEQPILSDTDAHEFAAQALEPYALTTFATEYRVDACTRTGDATAQCSTTITYALNPSNPQSCTLEVMVAAVGSNLESKPWDPTEIEEKNLQSPSGAYGDFGYVDTGQCEAASEASAG